jgi:hypothetical protein
MRWSRLRKLIIGLAFFSLVNILFGAPTPAVALSCARIPPVETAFENYEGVVVGQVDAAIRQDELDVVRLTVTVSQSFKGIKESKITITENATWGSLYGQSMVEEAYLFFLMENEGEWENPLCAPTKQVSAASEELEYLKNKELPLKSAIVPTGTSSEVSYRRAFVALVGILIGMIVFAFAWKRKLSKRR